MVCPAKVVLRLWHSQFVVDFDCNKNGIFLLERAIAMGLSCGCKWCGKTKHNNNHDYIINDYLATCFQYGYLFKKGKSNISRVLFSA